MFIWKYIDTPIHDIFVGKDYNDWTSYFDNDSVWNDPKPNTSDTWFGNKLAVISDSEKVDEKSFQEEKVEDEEI